jgi:hypothetical protein
MSTTRTQVVSAKIPAPMLGRLLMVMARLGIGSKTEAINLALDMWIREMERKS